MINRNAILLAAIAVELIVGAAIALYQKPQVAPLLPVSLQDDPLADTQIRELAANCKTADDWAKLGETYLAYGYFLEGEASFRIAVEREPTRADWVHHWGFALERIGRIEEANAQYRRAIELGHADISGCWYSIGRNDLRLENTDAAREAFEKAGTQPSARYELARLLVRAGKSAEAMPIVDRLAAEHPYAVHPFLLRHKVQVLGDDPAAAESGVAATIAAGQLPSPFQTDWKWLESAHDSIGLAKQLKEGIAFYKQGNVAAAVPLLQQVHRENNDVVAAGLLAAIAERNGNSVEAVRLLEEAIDRTGPSSHLFIILGETHAAAGRLDRAEEAWVHATRLGFGGQVKDAYHQLAQLYDKTGKADAARRNHALAYLAAGHEAFWNVQPADTKNALEKAIQYDPTLAPAWFYLGEMHRLQNEPGHARQAYQKCLSLDPNFGRAITGLSLLPK